MSRLHNLKELLARRRELRRNSTDEEGILWERLRNRKMGDKFRRQHSIGYFIIDFYCSDKRLVIELDGEQHENQDAAEYDSMRDEFLKECGYRTIRVKNAEIRNDFENVLRKIREALDKTPPLL